MAPQLVLARAGHYFNAGNGTCSAATVAKVHGEGSAVNLSVLEADGTTYQRTSVPVNPTPAVEDTTSSFHLTRDCPWGR